jgi:hypothetical protein
MSDRRDSGPLRLPPEREVSPQLRARVLHQAMREDRKPARPPTRVGPVLAGLAAAAVVFGVVYAFSRGGDGQTPATNQNRTGQTVGAHDVIETVVRAVPNGKIGPVEDRCSAATDVEADFRMTTELLRSPLGRVDVGAYALSKHHTQIFCTPFAVVTSVPKANIVTAQEPVRLVAGSRVQGLLPMLNHPDRRSYYDGAWFAVTHAVKQIEVRLVVNGEPLPWHAAVRTHAYLFAATWAPLTQLAGDVTVEYRAVSVDNVLMPMPAGLASSTVTPADTAPLNDQREVFPKLGQ